MRTALIAASFVAALATSTAASPAPSPLAPIGPWQVEFADSMCVLTRTYDDGARIRVLFLKPALDGDSFELAVGTRTDQVADYNGGRAVLATAGKGRVGPVEFTAYNTPELRLVRMNVENDKLALADLGDTLAVDARDEGRFLFRTAGIRKALPALTSCVGGLRQATR